MHKLLVWLEEPCKLSSAPGKMKSEESVSGGEKVQREAGDGSEPIDSESEMMDKEKESVTEKDKEDMNIPNSD